MPLRLLSAGLSLGLCLALLGVGGGAAGAGSSQRRAACSAGQVSLTFDDGPSSSTRRLVQMLLDLRVPATFFMVGQRVAADPAAARLVSQSGFLVANHSYAHAEMTRQTSAEIRATLRSTQRALTRAGARPTRLMRPPYGAHDARVDRAIDSAGFTSVLWDVDPRDWESSSSPATIAARILAQLRPNSSNVVLQHDGVTNSPNSISAVPRVVREARRRGYCFVALTDDGRPGFPVPSATLRTTDAAEGRVATAVVELDRPTARATTVRLVTRSRSARRGADFTDRRMTVTFPAGSTRRRVRIPLLRDGLDEPTERFEVTIDRPRGLTLGRASRVVRITDRDPQPTVSGVDLAVEEPVADQAVEVTFRLSKPSGRTIRLLLRTVAGSATEADYVAFRTRVVVPAGASSVTVPVTILADAEIEPDETFAVHLLRARFASIAGTDAVVTIKAQVPETPSEPRPGKRGRAHTSRR